MIATVRGSDSQKHDVVPSSGRARGPECATSPRPDPPRAGLLGGGEQKSPQGACTALHGALRVGGWAGGPRGGGTRNAGKGDGTEGDAARPQGCE